MTPTIPLAGASRRDRKRSTFMLLAMTALMLPLLFPPFHCFFLAPLALVPFCVCVVRRPLRLRYLGAYYLLGIAFFLPNLFWLGPVTAGGFVGLAFFVALYFPLFAVGLNRLVVQVRLPATVAVPLVWTAVEFIRASFVLGGFPWFLLGNCLTPMPVLIQAADLLGVWGLTFFLAMFNGYLVDVLRLPLRQPARGGGSRLSPVIRRLTYAMGMTILVMVAYGVWRLTQQTTTPGPRVAVIQENIPQALKDSPDSRDEVFLRHLLLTDQALAQEPRPDLVVWPETMVTTYINEELVDGTPDPFTTIEQLRALLAEATEDPVPARGEQRRIENIYQSLRDRVASSGTSLLVGYSAVVPDRSSGGTKLQNRTLLLVPAGEAGARAAVRSDEYSKRHLVPFGEFIPFRGVPVIAPLMLLFSPVDFDYSNTPGDRWTRFALVVASPGGERARYEFGTPICFEDSMPYPSRMMAAPQFHGGRKADFLANVSNDGWFHRVELDQHLQACRLRAVENRLPIARSVNTGNSGFIDSNGRIIKLVGDHTGSSIGAVGVATAVIPIDSRVTLFSRLGDLLPIVCGIVATLLTGWSFVRPRRGVGATQGMLKSGGVVR